MISVVIPAYNEEKFIGSCLESLAKQKTKKEFEVIVVNNNSTDTTQTIIEQFKDKLRLQVVFEKKKGRGCARAAGWKTARGEIILSTDADTIAPPYWIDRMVDHLQKSGAVALAGTGAINSQSIFTHVLFWLFQYFFIYGTRLMYRYYWLPGFNFAIYKKTYVASGGFNPQLNANEDAVLSSHVHTIGRIAHTHKIPVCVSERRFKYGFFKGVWMYLKLFLLYAIFKKDTTILSDIR